LTDSSYAAPRIVGRYEVHREIASGGMASVHMGRLVGEVGFSRVVAIKKLQPALSRDAQFRQIFLDEARVAARIRHPNVVSVIDVVSDGDELLLAMEYVHGESLSRLLEEIGGKPLQPAVAVSILAGTLYGLHAVHEARDEHGRPLCVVHCDVTPQNILVGVDGVARVTDFGIAKARDRVTNVVEAHYLQGKIAYMAPEQVTEQKVDRRADVYAASVVLWEMLTGQRLFEGESNAEIGQAILDAAVVPPSRINASVPRVLDEVVMRGLSADPDARFVSARQMAVELERAVVPAPAALVADFVERTARATLEERRQLLVAVEGAQGSASNTRRPSRPARSVAPPRPHETGGVASIARPSGAGSRSQSRVSPLLAVGLLTIALGAVATWWITRPGAGRAPPAVQVLGAASPPVRASAGAPTSPPSGESSPARPPQPEQAAPVADEPAPHGSGASPVKSAPTAQPPRAPEKVPGFGDRTSF
jgi:serine/threonine-protein kinase